MIVVKRVGNRLISLTDWEVYIMSILNVFKKVTKEFFSNCFSYLILFFSMNMMLFIVVTLFDFTSSFILETQRIPYISYTNLEVLIEKPIATILLLFLFLLLIVTIFFQFSYLLLGMRQIYQRRFNLVQLLKESISSVRHQKIASFGFFFFYFILILPIAQQVFNTQLLNKVVIPVFIMDFLANNIWYILMLSFVGLLIGYIAIRWLFILPFIILGNMSPRLAIKKSLELTQKRFWHFSWRIFILSLLSVGLKYFIFLIIYVLQAQLDTLANHYSLVGGIINLSLVQVINAIGGVWTSVLLIYLLMMEPDMLSFTQKNSQSKLTKARWLNRLNVLMIVTTCGAVLVFNIFFLNGLMQHTPKTVSHRGVDSLEHPNGVQNTIPALKKTMAIKPDYVEMDIQETKDQEFVMMHDPNLKFLTGRDAEPQRLTLAELTELTARENGMEAKVPSFDEYLGVANEGNQKLLIEIKTSALDSPELMDHFIQKYKTTILENGHEVQSLDYDVVTQLKKKAPEIPVSYILPYNFVFPNTKADAYTMEATTLTANFVVKSHAIKRRVYAWTVNDKKTMDKVMFMEVDGIITDEVSLLKEEIEKFEKSPSYSNQIMYYMSTIQNK